MEIGSLAQWAGATATSLAVLVALFKDQILQFIRKPKLNLSITLDSPDCHKTLITATVQKTATTFIRAECYYLRIWVKNSGKTRADNVQVFASELLKKRADSSFKAVDEFLPMNFVWSQGHSGPDGQEVFADGISPKMGKHCDLGHVVDPVHRKDFGYDLPAVSDGESILALDLEFKTNTLSFMLSSGVYRLILKLAASNCEPITKEIEITITGKWFSDQAQMFSDGLGIKVVR